MVCEQTFKAERFKNCLPCMFDQGSGSLTFAAYCCSCRPQCDGFPEKHGVPSQHPIVLICHLLTGGPCAIIKGAPGMTYLDLHNQCLSMNKAVVVKGEMAGYVDGYPGPYLLCALRSSSTPIFAAYTVCTKAASMMMVKVLHFKRLPVVFDLDETCIMASSASKYMKFSKKFKHLLQTLPVGSIDNRKAKRLIELLDEEQLILREYTETNSVQGKSAVLEPAQNELGQKIQRPVIRLDPELICTRIEPSSEHTSMLFRVRPNWFTILPQLTGDSPASTLFDVRVCTAGERGYAHEVWRILDPGPNFLIPPPRRMDYIVAGQTSKQLHVTLSLESTPSDRSAFPLAVIIDDRLDVWSNKMEQTQVLQIAPFDPWEEKANADLALQDELTLERLAEQMIRLRDQLFMVRQKVMEGIENLRSRYSSTFGSGSSLNMSDDPFAHYQEVLGPPPSIPDLLKAWKEGEWENLRTFPTDMKTEQVQPPSVPLKGSSFESRGEMPAGRAALDTNFSTTRAAIANLQVIENPVISSSTGEVLLRDPRTRSQVATAAQVPAVSVQQTVPEVIQPGISAAMPPSDPRKRRQEGRVAVPIPSNAVERALAPKDPTAQQSTRISAVPNDSHRKPVEVAPALQKPPKVDVTSSKPTRTEAKSTQEASSTAVKRRHKSPPAVKVEKASAVDAPPGVPKRQASSPRKSSSSSAPKKDIGSRDTSLKQRHLWLGNLLKEATAADVQKIFESFGAVEGVAKTYRKFAFVDFVKSREAAAAKKQLENKVLPRITGKLPLIIDWTGGKVPTLQSRPPGQESRKRVREDKQPESRHAEDRSTRKIRR